MIWDKSRQNFVELYNITGFANFQGQTPSMRLDLHAKDISGKVLRASYYEEPDLVMFYENDTKVTGICGDIWNLLAYHLNFTLMPIHFRERNFGERLENGSYNGVMGLLERNETQVILRTGYYPFRANLFDYTMPIWNIKYQLFIKPKYGYDNRWMITMFAPKTWYVIIILFLVLSVAGYILQIAQFRNYEKKERSTRRFFSFKDHIFYSYSIMCCQGYLPLAFHNQNKALSISKSIFAWLILLTFGVNLIYRMAHRTVIPPFTSFDTLLNKTKYDVLVFKGSVIYEFVKNTSHNQLTEFNVHEISERIHFVNNANSMYKEVCYGKELYAMLESQDKAFSRSREFCVIIPMGESYFETWVGFGVPKNFPYKYAIDMSIIKLHEVGLIEALKERWLNYPDEGTRRPFTRIDLNQVYLIFIILVVGTLLSLVILILENIIFFVRNS
ncbi:PREDICTED: glutamate receptor 3.2-like [Eufriesea mexicana]|uniref:glutamate receptor 3.2-like n=1 Tax=Eufriesea mexicana TaxID=516756 RepID=UPI00083C565C|nr:PREDICTED: glutamate receptor 3.2-like [Eufriesea mexicana]